MTLNTRIHALNADCRGARRSGARRGRRDRLRRRQRRVGETGSSQSAADFIRQVTTQFSRGQSGPLWDTLHPGRPGNRQPARYMACQSNSGFDLKKIKVLQTYPDTVDIAGRATPSTAVSVRVTSDDGITNATMHAVKIKGKWRWILSARRLHGLQARQVSVLLASTSRPLPQPLPAPLKNKLGMIPMEPGSLLMERKMLQGIK